MVCNNEKREGICTSDYVCDSGPSTLIVFNLVLAFVQFARPE
jgi:hypothetical protein